MWQCAGTGDILHLSLDCVLACLSVSLSEGSLVSKILGSPSILMCTSSGGHRCHRLVNSQPKVMPPVNKGTRRVGSGEFFKQVHILGSGHYAFAFTLKDG